MRRSSSAGLPVALVASVVLHVAAAALAIAPRALAAPDPPPDVWAGTSVELLTASDLPTPSVAAAPSDPSSPGAQGEAAEPPRSAAEPTPADPPRAPEPKQEKATKTRKEKAKKEAEPRAEPKAKKEAEPKAEPKAAKAEPHGETPAPVPPEETPREAAAPARRGLHPLPNSFRVQPHPTPTRSLASAVNDEKRKEAREAKAQAPGAGEASPAASAAPAGGSFGAVGAAQVRDLGSSFTRAIAPAGQPDLTWGSLPVGDAGSIEVALDVDDEGKITGFTPRSAAPPAQLVGLVKRVLAVLRSGHFSIRGPAASAGVQVLRISAKTSDLVDPGLIQGGLVQLAYTFENGKGHSSFTQVTGRHVEVDVEVRKVEVAGAK